MSQQPRLSEKKLSAATKPLLLSQSVSHNMYPDLKNKWAPNALEFDYSISDIFCFFVVVFLLGWLCSQLIMFAFKSSAGDPQEIEILEPYFFTTVENTFEYIDYAASKNGGKILKELSTPELHGILAPITPNNLDSLLLDDNSAEICWPIMGKHGHAAIQLSAEIYPVGFSIVFPKKFKDTMPKDVRVYSLDSDSSYELARCKVEANPQDIRITTELFFPCQTNCMLPTQIILVEINDNYGGEYTCLYQFKVHGLPSKK